ncbi:MAG TPA: N-acetyltransferase, partial [Bacteroidota bacterium]|nr:N-acetyltransferase [Bacteroidota bacterium]
LWPFNLFDEEIANTELFGAEPKLVMNNQNVYYRSSKPLILKAPSRILWYVSYNKNYPGSKGIRASSLVEEIAIAGPKELFRRYQHLGIYEWQNVYEIAQHDINKEIMAFRFTNTELFDKTINYCDLKNIIFNSEGKNISLQAPYEIKQESFYTLYKMGIEK